MPSGKVRKAVPALWAGIRRRSNPLPDNHFSPHSIGHLGFSGCSLWIDLDAAIAAVLLTNRTWPDRKSQLIREVRPAFHDAVRESSRAVSPVICGVK